MSQREHEERNAAFARDCKAACEEAEHKALREWLTALCPHNRVTVTTNAGQYHRKCEVCGMSFTLTR
jgi:hypothetical protein